jgi:hypothetical protein
MCVHSSASMEIHSAGALSPLAPRPHDENGTVVGLGRARTLTSRLRRCVPARRNLASDKCAGNTYDMVTTHRRWGWTAGETNISTRIEEDAAGRSQSNQEARGACRWWHMPRLHVANALDLEDLTLLRRSPRRSRLEFNGPSPHAPERRRLRKSRVRCRLVQHCLQNLLNFSSLTTL